MSIPIWAFIILCVGCLPTAILALVVIGALALWLIDEIREKRK